MLEDQEGEDDAFDAPDALERVEHAVDYREHILMDVFEVGLRHDLHLAGARVLTLFLQHELQLDHGAPLARDQSQIVGLFAFGDAFDVVFALVDQVDILLVPDRVDYVGVADLFIAIGEAK